MYVNIFALFDMVIRPKIFPNHYNIRLIVILLFNVLACLNNKIKLGTDL